MVTTAEIRGVHPRPQAIRPDRWQSLDGPWQFAFDDTDIGVRERWYARDGGSYDQTILVPFPPESQSSGIGDKGDHAALWYRRSIDLAASELGDLGSDRLVLHFGAVDHECDVWVDGQHATRHEGGQTPFSVDITDLLDANLSPDHHFIVVRATDDRTDVEQPRGKQDWRPEQHVIWYDRTSGIWRTVWLERVAPVHVSALRWRADLGMATAAVQVRLNRGAPAGARVGVNLFHQGETIGSATVAIEGEVEEIIIPIPRQTNGLEAEALFWTPESPTLIDAEVLLHDGTGAIVDRVESYLGLRSVGVSGNTLLLNGRPFYMRAVLEQGYWPQSHLTPPSLAALREAVELTKNMGFNTVRVHQKVEDPRYLYWCDALGLAVWAETAAACRFTDEAVVQLTREWLDIVRRDISHPSVIAWVPFNESWGIPGVSSDPRQTAYSRALADLTRALDGTRPVMSNDGWEHTNSDLLTVHDYEPTGAILTQRYATPESTAAALSGMGPAGWRLWADGSDRRPGTIPVILSEFGGVGFDPKAEEGNWGYSIATSAEELEARLTDIMNAVHDARGLAGYCYTQMTDTGLETNGLAFADRTPKLPLTTLHRIFAGRRA